MPAANSSAGLVSAIAMAAQTTSNPTAAMGDFAAMAPIASDAMAANPSTVRGQGMCSTCPNGTLDARDCR